MLKRSSYRTLVVYPASGKCRQYAATALIPHLSKMHVDARVTDDVAPRTGRKIIRVEVAEETFDLAREILFKDCASPDNEGYNEQEE